MKRTQQEILRAARGVKGRPGKSASKSQVEKWFKEEKVIIFCLLIGKMKIETLVLDMATERLR